MSAARVLQYHAAFRTHWNMQLQNELLNRFDLDPAKKVNAMSKGMRSQLALVCAVCPEPAILLLDEPTSGLDPIIRREFLQTVIGAYMESAPGQKTVLVSTHLIGEWEGMIDEFTIIDKGRALLTMETEAARQVCRRIHARWPGEVPELPPELGRRELTRGNAPVHLLTTQYTPDMEAQLRALGAEHVEVEPLNLEDIFVATAGLKAADEVTKP
jgi:ABC-2 type transport system ATP-binding protein